ncbi:MAG: hypothetical protein JW997_02640 [Actinobacteria bacterium]|nr:hypothetical protein [Actinomycetota bacterium]
MKKNRALILIDGTHKPDNTVESINELKNILDFEVKKLLWIGGTEKIKTKSSFSQAFEKEFFTEVIFPEVFKDGRLNSENALRNSLKDGSIDTVIQLCGAPQVFRHLTNRFANIAVSFGASYVAGGTVFKEYRVNINHNKPSIGLYATNKRVGKTAFGSYIGRLVSGMKNHKTGLEPIIITHSRGGPPEPVLLEIYKDRLDRDISEIGLDDIYASRFRTDYLERLLDFDLHGASDVFEDALIMSAYIDEWESSGKKVPVIYIIGCRRAGAGYFQEFMVSNVEKGVAKANQINGNIVIHEGSGGEHPPVKVDGTIYFVPSDMEPAMLEDFPGIESAGLVILANCQAETVEVADLLELERIISAKNPEATIIWTQFVTEIIGNTSILKNKNIVFLTTAPQYILNKLAGIIESKYGCNVLKALNCLDRREEMLKAIDDIVQSSDVDYFIFEIKAQGVEGAKYVQQNYGRKFLYVNNVPQEVDRLLKPLAGNENLDSKILDAVNNAIKNYHKQK